MFGGPKNVFTENLLKPTALAAQVFSDFRIRNSGSPLNDREDSHC